MRRSEHRTLVHHHRDWGKIRADIVKRTGLSRQETHLTPEQHSLLINLKGEARSGEDFIEGHKIAFTPRRPGSVIFLPAHCEWSGWDEGDTSGSYLLVSIDTKFTAQTLGARLIPGLKPAIGFRNSVIESSLQRIAAEVMAPDPISTIMVESQAVQIFVHLMRLNGVGSKPVKGGLSAFDLRRVLAKIEKRLSDPPSLDELAQEVGVSRRHFFRAFKQSTGKTPHAYLSDHRMEHAVDLLRNTDLSVTGIALACGFASSSHFTFAFRRSRGASPSEFRRTWRR